VQRNLEPHRSLRHWPSILPLHRCLSKSRAISVQTYVHRYLQHNTTDLEERHIGFVESEANYQKLVDQAVATYPQHTYLLDASTAYLYSAKAPVELRHYAPATAITPWR